jgi:hypothetical protein
MEAEESTEDFIADLIAENCQYCKHMWEDIHTSPCICGNIGDAILYHARIEREKEFVAEWERQQLELQQIFGVVAIQPDAPERPEVNLPEERFIFEFLFGDTVYPDCAYAHDYNEDERDCYCKHPSLSMQQCCFCGSNVRIGTCPIGKQQQPKPELK